MDDLLTWVQEKLNASETRTLPPDALERLARHWYLADHPLERPERAEQWDSQRVPGVARQRYLAMAARALAAALGNETLLPEATRP